MDYLDWKYMDLKKECAKRGIGGRDKRDVLIHKLIADDSGCDPARESKPEPPEIKREPPKPNPDNPNYDENGRWRRRPPGFISWEDEALKEL
jgi:hypothetical protein